ncbi:GNAT family N-acetyltransferase [Isobaculum melis]|uniref:Acetyltransferase (GNAT) family protein n=1 Tax=Isobaculum melis TaxID=142588 RepID=A0A1H9U8N6_9LACT|nr:GNAT family N-acetyltransferase [Isobaculum melis]SES05940.1 Acetyltransferase (GNAT) family protein [Isobaculum melis]
MEILSINRLSKKQEQEVITLISETWQIDKQISKQADRERVLKLFITVLFLTNNFAFFAVLDHKIVGLIIGKATRHYRITNFLYYGMKMLQQIGFLPFYTQEAKQYLKEYFNISDTQKRLIKQTEKMTNEVSLFAVSPTHQGMGIGKQLMAKAIQQFQSLQIQQFKLFTDTRCSYQFYDKNNFQLQATQKVWLTPQSEETIMLYAKNISC